MHIFNNVGNYVKAHSSAILTGVGIVGFVSSGVLACKATPGALAALNETNEALVENGETNKKVIFMARVKALLPYYGVPVTLAIGSGACVIAAHKIDRAKQLALSTAYLGAEETLKAYQKKVVEKIGEKKEKEISDEIRSEKAREIEDVGGSDLLTVNDGKMLCKDVYSGQLFRSTPELLRKAEGIIKARLQSEDFIPINEFYYELELPSTDAGKQGWNIGLSGPNSDLIKFNSCLAADGVTPMLAVELCDVGPRIDYYGV